MAMFDALKHEPGVQAFKAGSVVFQEGEAGDSMYAVVEGEVEIRKGSQVLEVVGPGGVFGEMALIDHEPRSASALAVSDAKIVSIPEKRFLLLVQQTPYFALQMMQLLTSRLRRDLAK